MWRCRWSVTIGLVVSGCVSGMPTVAPARPAGGTGDRPWHVATWVADGRHPPVPWAQPGLVPLGPVWGGPFAIQPASPAILPVDLPSPPDLPKAVHPPGPLLTPVLPPIYGGLGYGALGYGGLGYDLAPYPLLAYTDIPATLAAALGDGTLSWRSFALAKLHQTGMATAL